MAEAPDTTYVFRLYQELRRELEGLHRRIVEVEALRYLEEKIPIPGAEKQSGLEIRVGLTAELIENVKSALTTNLPSVTVRPLRSGDLAQANSSKREKLWRAFIQNVLVVLNELADAQSGLGLGILKAAYYPWPTSERRRLKGESDAEYNDRQRALKRQWGLPYKVITIHPLTYFFRLGAGEEIVESIEHSWKSRRQVYEHYNVPDPGTVTVERIAASMGQPVEDLRALPYGTSTETMALVTEYWSPQWYQVYLNGQKVHEEENPRVRYFVCKGRTTSSKDPDKWGLSVAEILRHNEPTINLALTRMAEATELIVRKRLTLEVPEGFMSGEELGEDNNPVTKTYKFEPDHATALPAQSRVVDPFSGVENVYAAMPFINLILQLTSQHGVSPLFKGIPPGAVGSGYRDNSLYLMAKSQFQYIIDSFEDCLSRCVSWIEQDLVRVGQEVWQDELSLTPKDIREFPAILRVSVEPLLPQNVVSLGQFYDRMWAEGHIPRRLVLEKGMREEQPEELVFERMKEDIKEMLKPILFKDVLQTVFPQLAEREGAEEPGQGGDGRVQALGGTQGPGGAQMLLGMLKQARGQGEAGQAMGGYTRQGMERQPPTQPGAFPPELEERV